MTVSEERQMGRAKNAALSFLEQRLSVPKIYIDAVWAGHHVDVLAIDRDGVGDVHAILLFAGRSSGHDPTFVDDLVLEMRPLVELFSDIPAQYKYLASVNLTLDGRNVFPGVPHEIDEKSFSPDGIGRIGFLAIDFTAEGPKARTVFKPERFRARVTDLADEYVQQHTADWEIRA